MSRLLRLIKLHKRLKTDPDEFYDRANFILTRIFALDASFKATKIDIIGYSDQLRITYSSDSLGIPERVKCISIDEFVRGSFKL